MWTAVSGASAQAGAVDIVANNLANADTPTFKKDLPTFKEYMTGVERAQSPKEILRGPIKEGDFYPDDGRDVAHVINDATYTDFTQGTLRVTQAPLDVALSGPGFLEVLTPQGVRLTRNGSLKVSVDGRLITSEGHAVLSQTQGAGPATLLSNVQNNSANRQPAAANGIGDPLNSGEIGGRLINLKGRTGGISITEAGEIYVGEDLVGKLSLFEFKNPKENQKIRKAGGGLFMVSSAVDASSLSANPATKIKQGMIETSNVNPVQEMTQLIRANRMFEHNLKALKTYGEMMGKEANEIGKF